MSTIIQGTDETCSANTVGSYSQTHLRKAIQTEMEQRKYYRNRQGIGVYFIKGA